MKFAVKVVLMLCALLAGLLTGFSQTVTLQWDQSSDPDVVACHVYYGASSHSYTNFVATGPATTATVSNLVPGQVYYFAATTINSAGLESELSGEVAYLIGSTPCSISLAGLVQTYDGTPKPISVTTSPPDLTTIVTYAGALDPPVDVGQYAVTVAVMDSGCVSGVSAVLTIAPPNALIQLTGLDQIYDGLNKPVQVSTSPANLPVSVTYNGLPDPPVDPGMYDVVASVQDPSYAGTAIGLLTIEKDQALIGLRYLDQTYDGSAKAASVSTYPPNLAVRITYNGVAEAPTNAGSYEVVAEIVDDYFAGVAADTLTIEPAEAQIQLDGLDQVFDGSPKPVVVTTVPPGLAVDLSYNGQVQAPFAVGDYAVVATVQDPNYTGSDADWLSISAPSGSSAPVKWPTWANASTLLLLWPTDATNVTIWQSSDLTNWVPASGTMVTANSLAIVPVGNLVFLRATDATADATNAVPLSILRH